MFKPNTLFYSDGYKIGHKRMLAPGTDYLYGTWIPRSTKHAPKGITKIVSYGQQLTMRWLHDEFKENFFALDKEDAMQFASDMSLYLGLEFDGDHFGDLHDLGYLPIRVKALTEGIQTGTNIPHMTFINTKGGFAWLTLYLETIISSLAWKPSTSATIALQYRKRVTEWVLKTDPAQAFLIPFMCHDFSARGLSPWDMLSSGLGHATSFRGSDSIICIPGARYFYDEPKNEVAINSVNASEHSVSTTKIFTVGESQMLTDWIDLFPIGILSVVSDTFDLWTLITKYLPENKEAIMNRDGKLVIRPDSGDPVDIICGIPVVDSGYKGEDLETWKEWVADTLDDIFRENLNAEEPHHSEEATFSFNGQLFNVEYTPDLNRHDKTYYYVDNYGSTVSKCTFTEIEATPERKGVIQLLWEIFGGTVNEQGYKVLDSHIGAIYGDSITLERQQQMYERLAANGFASTNIVLGVGSYTYQMNTRDTLGFAAKGAWFSVTHPDGSVTEHDIFKDPITDDGTKKSLKGRVMVFINNNGEYKVKTECTQEEEIQGELHTIYEDGEFYNPTTFQQVRDRINLLVS